MRRDIFHGGALAIALLMTVSAGTIRAAPLPDQGPGARPGASLLVASPSDTTLVRFPGLRRAGPQRGSPLGGGPQGPGQLGQGRQGQGRQGFQGGQRQMSMLNPEISMSADFLAWYLAEDVNYPDPLGETTTGEPGFIPTRGSRFFFREVELNVVAPLDPYTRGKFFLCLPEGGSLEIEEAYMQWINLPAGLSLKIGYYRNQFGQLNRWHEHALPNVDRPVALYTFLGRDGLAGTGISTNWLLGSLIAHVNELDLEFINGGDGLSFDRQGKENQVTVARLKNYWDLSAASYLELGISGATGYWDTATRSRSTLAGLDLNYKWVPIGRGGYRTFELRAELLRSIREGPTGDVEGTGGYVLAQNRMGTRWWLGVRADYAETPWDPSQIQKGGAVTATYWQSEFVVFRFQYGETLRNFTGDDRRFTIQAVWAMGPHKHEAY